MARLRSAVAAIVLGCMLAGCGASGEPAGNNTAGGDSAATSPSGPTAGPGEATQAGSTEGASSEVADGGDGDRWCAAMKSLSEANNQMLGLATQAVATGERKKPEFKVVDDRARAALSEAVALAPAGTEADMAALERHFTATYALMEDIMDGDHPDASGLGEYTPEAEKALLRLDPTVKKLCPATP